MSRRTQSPQEGAPEVDSAPGSEERRRRPGRFRRWLVRPLVWLLVLLVVLFAGLWAFLQSSNARTRLETLLEDQVSGALGRPVRLDAVDFDLFPPALEARDVVVPGPGPDDPPVLEVPWLRVEIRPADLWRRVVRLRQVELERPRVMLLFDEEGTSNLPSLPQGSGGEPSFEIQIDHLLVRQGSLRLEQMEVPLELDARDLWGRLSGGSAAAGGDRVRVLLTSPEVTTRLPEARPVPVAVSLEATIDAESLEILHGSLRNPELDAEVRGRIGWPERGAEGDLRVVADGDGSLANRLGYLEEPLAGPVRFEGSVVWGEEGWSWGGDLTSRRLDFLNRRFGDLSARLDGGSESVRVEVASAAHAGGTLSGIFTLSLGDEVAGGLPARIEARGRNLAIRRLLDDLNLPLAGVGGGLSGELTYRFSTAEPLGGSGEGAFEVAGVRRREDVLSLSGTVPVAVDRGHLTIRQAHLTAPSQSLSVDVEASLSAAEGTVGVELDTEDLGRLAVLLPPELLQANAGPGSEAGEDASTAESPPWLPRQGAGEIRGVFAFSAVGLSGEVAFDLDEVAAPVLAVDRLEGSFRLTPAREGLRVEGLSVEARRGDGELRIAGAVDLGAGLSEDLPSNLPAESGDGAAEASPGLDLTVTASGWPVETVASLVPQGVALGGSLDGEVRVGGTFGLPTVRGRVAATSLTVAELTVDRAEAVIEGRGSRFDVERLELGWPMGAVSVRGSLDLAEGSMDLAMEAPGLDLGAEPLASRVAGDLRGLVDVEAVVTGTLEAPSAELTLSGRELALGERSLGERGHAEMRASWQGRQLEAEGSLLGLLRFEGGGRLDREGLDLSFDVQSDELLRIVELVVEEGQAPAVDGSLGGSFLLRGRFDAPEDLVARLELPRLTLRYEGETLENLMPVTAEIHGGSLTVQSLYLGQTGTDNELFLTGSMGLEGDFPLDLKLQGTADTSWVQPFLSGISVGGTFEALASVRGTLSEPKIDGQGRLRDGQAILAGFPHALERVSATLLFYPGRVVLDDGSAAFAGGRVRAAGQMTLPLAGGSLGYQLQVQGENLTLRYPEGWILRGGAELNLIAPARGADRELRGVVTLERAIYAEDVPTGLTSLLQQAFERERLVVRESNELLTGTQVSLSIRGPEALRVRNNLASLTGSIDLTVRRNLARPVVFGQVELEPGGKLTFRDTDYTVQRGLLTFSNPESLEPVIDLVASTKVKSYDIQLLLSGTLERLDASFVSDPPLADLEVLSLLATGSTPDDFQSSSGLAESFLYGQAASVISRRVNTLFGFDRFRIQPGGTGNELSGGIGFVAEKQLSRDVTVIFSRDPSSPEREIFQVEWSVTDQLTLIATGEGDSSYALDVRWEKSF